MKQPTKTELKDRIAYLEATSKSWSEMYCKAASQRDTSLIEARRATIAAYALLATLATLVFCEVIW